MNGESLTRQARYCPSLTKIDIERGHLRKAVANVASKRVLTIVQRCTKGEQQGAGSFGNAPSHQRKTGSNAENPTLPSALPQEWRGKGPKR